MRHKNESIDTLIERRVSRRDFMAGGIGLASAAFLGGTALAAPGSASASAIGVASQAAGGGRLGFDAISTSTADQVRVPLNYTARVLYAWGDPVSDGPAFRQDGLNTAEEQAQQAGMNHDGMQFFPLPLGSDNADHGLLVMNHEFTDEGLLHGDGEGPDGQANLTAEKVRKSQAAHGVSVIEVRKVDGQWEVVRPSKYGRRVTAYTPMRVGGPAAGSELLKTEADPEGREILGTFHNCAHGYTPWGTYLACEENWDVYFRHPTAEVPEAYKRYGVSDNPRWRWADADERFDTGKNPNEPNRFGYVVEIDPYDPNSTPVKRTALGRFKHENAAFTLAKDGRVVYYMGDDDWFEYVYKFVSSKPWQPMDREANRDLLDDGTLYVARYDDQGGGEWIPLVYGQNGLTEANGFKDQADVLVHARKAADVVGATPMDRPEWIAVHPETRQAYVALTQNGRRGDEGSLTRRDFGSKDPNAPNPREDNVMGHILRWKETGNDPAADTFRWDIFVMAGNPNDESPNRRGNIRGDMFAQPDGMAFDPRGILWINTDMGGGGIYPRKGGAYEAFGNNMLMAADTETGEVRRFLTGPVGSEITGAHVSPDGTTLFVNIQHPGGGGDHYVNHRHSNPKEPKAISSWPDGARGGRPRPATVVVTKNDGGLIGT
ncbi:MULTISPECIES: PhoX family phosphatase [unclassified Thioalkalivibrio]|uniref:PhoX family protein n=1 Tax=unclassified Thioalkalivibrio TaxID=2621013 RepID=UPI000365E636|nr:MULTISPECIES: PhoX family phosphatase [unclassified Thioalkalivibrio]